MAVGHACVSYGCQRQNLVKCGVFFFALLLVCHLTTSSAMPVFSRTQASNYLRRYGYLKSKNSVALSDKFPEPTSDLSSAVKQLQEFAGLPPTDTSLSLLKLASSTVNVKRSSTPDLPRNHITDALVSLHWLRVSQRIEYMIAVLTYEVLHGSAPRYLSPLVPVSDLPLRHCVLPVPIVWRCLPSGSLPSAAGLSQLLVYESETPFQMRQRVIDSRTLSVMSLPRCGLPDDSRDFSKHQRHKRYAVEGPPWPTKKLNYYFVNFTQHLPQSVVRNIVRQAVEMWSNASSLTIRETPEPREANIRLQYSVQHHDDNFPFDGTGGVLAHAFYRDSGPTEGQAHFDDDDKWSNSGHKGTISLLQVTAHEIGHTLGLGHSSEPGSVMTPFYDGFNANFRLAPDDILGIKTLYDTPTNGATESSAVTSAAVNPTSRPGIELCDNATVDAAVAFNLTTYFFKGTAYIVVDNSSGVTTIRNGYPRPLSVDWPSLNAVDEIDAALYVPATAADKAQLFLFRQTQYWRYSRWPMTSRLDSGYPRPISEGFPGVPDSLDAAFVWGRQRHIYFIKGSQYYRYTRKLGVDPGYPKPLSLWRGLPSGSISAAFQAENSPTYFFSGEKFSRFNDILFTFAPTVSALRGHSLKLFMPRARLHLGKYFFSHRVISYWNSLPQHVVEAPTMNCFKSRLDRHWQDIDVYKP